MGRLRNPRALQAETRAKMEADGSLKELEEAQKKKAAVPPPAPPAPPVEAARNPISGAMMSPRQRLETLPDKELAVLAIKRGLVTAGKERTEIINAILNKGV